MQLNSLFFLKTTKPGKFLSIPLLILKNSCFKPSFVLVCHFLSIEPKAAKEVDLRD